MKILANPLFMRRTNTRTREPFVSRPDALSAESLSVRRGQRAVLEKVTLALRGGEVVSVLGANGAGKSTLLAVLSGEPDALACCVGEVSLNGGSLVTVSPNEQARQRAVLPQKPGLGFDFQVSEVVAMGAYPFVHMSAADVSDLVVQAMASADTVHLTDRRYLELSGGEQQRVQFARVLVQVMAAARSSTKGRYLLLDEPTASLDPLHQQQLLRSVHHVSRQLGVGVLVVMHDVNLAAFWSDRIALLCDGSLLDCDTPQRVLTAGNLKAAYGVTAHIVPHPLCGQRQLVVFGTPEDAALIDGESGAG